MTVLALPYSSHPQMLLTLARIMPLLMTFLALPFHNLLLSFSTDFHYLLHQILQHVSSLSNFLIRLILSQQISSEPALTLG